MRRLFAILLAIGTPTGAIAYYGIPGGRSHAVITVPFGQSGAYIPCLTADGCEMECHVVGSSWTCTEDDGTAVTVTNATGNGTENCFSDPSGASRTCLTDITDATAPYIASGDVPASIDWTAPHTVIAVYLPRNTDSATARAWAHGVLSTDGLEVRATSSSTSCYWSAASTSIFASVSIAPLDSWGVASCVQTSDTDRHARYNGNVSTTLTTNLTVAAPSNNNLYFGRRDATGRAMRGAYHQWLFFSAAKSAAYITTAEETVNGTGPVTFSRNSTAWCKDPQGQYLAVGQDMPCVMQDGYNSWIAVTNYALYSIDATNWSTSTGASVKTVDALAGPFSVYNNGAEIDEVEDDDGGVAEFFVLESNSITDSTFTISFWAKSGTRSQIRVDIGCKGGGSGTLLQTVNLDSTLTRYEYTTTCSGGTGTYWRLYPATQVASETGSVYFGGIQFEVADHAGRPCIAGSSATTCAADTMLDSNVGVPTVQGRVEFDYTPDLADPGIATTAHLIDTGSGGVTDSGISMAIPAAKELRIRTSTGSAATSSDSAALTWTPGTSYGIRGSWAQGNHIVVRDGTVEKQATGATMPDAHTGSTFGICNRDNLDKQCNGSIKNLRFYLSP